jgi:hypothetical protein
VTALEQIPTRSARPIARLKSSHSDISFSAQSSRRLFYSDLSWF